MGDLSTKTIAEMTAEEFLTLSSQTQEKKYVYGIPGIAELFHCSKATANRIKASGKIDKAIVQIGRKIIVDVDLALELAAKSNRSF
jgi:2,4-dienoyl-CoA reductase-like NADH-dependent reductase (Old Yellow Enzyme family)